MKILKYFSREKASKIFLDFPKPDDELKESEHWPKQTIATKVHASDGLLFS